MAQVFARASVEDYANFRKIFDDHEQMRASAGATESTIYQSVDDPNEVIIHVEFPTTEEAKAFESSDELREAMKLAKMTAPPRILIVNKT